MNSYDWSKSQVYQYIIEHMFDGCCSPWPHGTTRGGYGIVRIPRGSGKNGFIRVGRLVCFLENGPAPAEKPFARHLCGKGHLGCFNAACIVWGSKKDNEEDKKIHGTILAGEKHNMAKLNWSDVAAIRALKGSHPQREIASRFGVTQTTISLIHRERIWIAP